MNLSGIVEGDIIQFVARVDNSSVNQPIQNVILSVEEITETYVRGISGLKTLQNSKITYRTYRIENIVQGTVWKLVG